MNFQLEGESAEPTFRRLVLRSVAHVVRLYSLFLVTESEVFLFTNCPCVQYACQACHMHSSLVCPKR